MRIVFEKVPDSEGSSFGCFHAGGRVFDCPYHIHPEVEILHILSGRGLLVVGDYIGRFAPGNLFLLGSGLPHMLCGDPATSDASEPTHIRYAQFKRENFGDAFWQMPEQKKVAQLLTQSARGICFDEGSTPRLLPTMDRLWETYGARRLWSLMELLEEMVSVGEMPTLADRSVPIWAGNTGRATSVRMRFIVRSQASTWSSPQSSRMNSSPPTRATVSPTRTAVLSRLATSTST